LGVMLLSISLPLPKRGEVWRINFDPTIGAEIKKVRPAIVISSDAIGILPIKLVAPITTWNTSFTGKLWLVSISPDGMNGLTQDSVVDTLQVRGVEVQRFIQKIGLVSSNMLEEIAAAIAIVVEYQ